MMIDKVLDACCGTGGFLIEAMADLTNKIYKNPSLSSTEKEQLVESVRTECLYGIDAGKSPPVARIARINMFSRSKDTISHLQHLISSQSAFFAL